MNFDRLYTVILGPHGSEKAALLGDANNQYVFKVARSATKPEIKKAVETLFNVSVVNLQVMLVKGKTKRGAGGRVRRRSDWKKAYIRLEAGHEIDFANIT